MTTLVFALAVLAILFGGGYVYSRFLGRAWGEDARRTTPAVRINDGRDFVPTPTPVVFAHHFASIAGAGPIVGPIIAVCYGWMPALLWVVFGSLFIGAVHDYLALHMTTREGGHSVATVARRLLGTGPFLALMLFLVLTLALVCATFLNLSAKALVSMVPLARLSLDAGQTLFRVIGSGDSAKVVIGGIASTSVIVITAFAPLVGWLYIRRHVAVWKCSFLAMAICAVSVVVGVWLPVAVSETTWKIILAAYVFAAAGLPVWLFLQSRDFINVHFLYAGLVLLTVTLLVVFFRPHVAAADAIPAWNLAAGTRAIGSAWPLLFITIACGAVSGFHSLCAGGTTCKQIRSETVARRIGYGGMMLESFLGLCVIAVVVLAVRRLDYFADVHPVLVELKGSSNPILGFAMAVGSSVQFAFGISPTFGALAGMLLLEGFVVTTLDTAVRLMRYLLEEIWRVLFGAPAAATAAAPLPAGGADETAGTSGIPASIETDDDGVRPLLPLPRVAAAMQHYMVSSGMAVLLTLWFAFSGGVLALWGIFATANQLLAAFGLGIGALWLLRQRRQAWPVAIPALFMFAVTGSSLFALLAKFRPAQGPGNPTLYAADWVLIVLTTYLLVAGAFAVARLYAVPKTVLTASR